MTGLRIAGREIPEEAVAAEMQNHHAESVDAAREDAVRALVVRELLLNEAGRQALAPEPQPAGPDKRETDDDALIRQLLEAKVPVPEPDEAACRAYYESDPARFKSPDLFEAAHILRAAAPGDEVAYGNAVSQAEALLRRVEADPRAFAVIARENSDCSSGKSGGALGQVAEGDTAPEFETFLFNLEPGQICPVVVKSRYGAHVLRLDRKIAGRDLPFDSVHQRIAAFLGERAWRRAVQFYIAALAAAAEIEGIDPASLVPIAGGQASASALSPAR